MVLRKSTSQSDLVPAPLSQAANNPPYPTTPISEHRPALPVSSASDWEEVYSPNLTTSPAFNLRTLDEAKKTKEQADDSSNYSTSDWEQSDAEDDTPEDLPNPLKIGGGKPLPTLANKTELPDALRAGPPAGIPIKKSLETIAPDLTGASASSYGGISNGSAGSTPLKTNNPYLRMQPTGQSDWGGESSQQAWGDVPSQAPSYGQLAELPTHQTPDSPTNPLANLNLNSDQSSQQRSHSLDQPPLIAVDPASPQSAHPRQDSRTSEGWNPGMDVSSLDAFSRSHGLPEDSSHPETPHRTWQEQQAWESSERERRQHELAIAHAAAVKAEQERGYEEEFNRQEQAAKPTTAAPTTAAPTTAVPTPSNPFTEVQVPTLPPRRNHEQEQPLQVPPRPIDTAIGSPSATGLESPTTVMNNQRKEHYQIKHIRWHDVNTRGIRTSPILTQNLNGPCPLLALVNALVLSTPSGTETALGETLRTREQVSLGLLLDAVFDELMSGRRGGAAQELPDVSELYKFLLTLHTGLNVNPMFVQDPGSTDGTATLSPSLAGGFEATRDMRLYKTFDVPLMHGWLPEAGSEAYVAFDRVAKTYETSQYVQFQEEELDAKLQAGDTLNDNEQQMFTDIHAIKEFLSRWPTQLTDYGLRTVRESLQPGQFGILFRNDHFSTLYKDPRTNNLITLVTDQGYSSHDEIVWESLVDVNGQGSELYSGDFRPVGNTAPPRQQNQPPVQSMLDVGNNQGGAAVASRRGNQSDALNTLVQGQTTNPPVAGSTEQEDHDLALALQLQEEEDDRHRRSVDERRRQENQLSEDAIASHANVRPSNRRASRPGEVPPVIPPRRNNVQTNRPNNEAAPPPTYEEAATNPPYNPPPGHPANANAPLAAPGSAYQQNSQGMPTGPSTGGRRTSGRFGGMQQPQHPGRPGRRQSAGAVGSNGQQEDRDKCVVM